EILRKHFGSESKQNQKEIIPTEFTLYQNYPNPFNPNTTIKYDIPASLNPSKGGTLVNLIIYDILGRRVKVLVNEIQQAGRYEVQFNASNLASGIYIYQLIAEKFISSKKMILLK
ncbi:MAG: T9SS type A sorting domain-containing protein, partial [Ignavibacteriaceae bacterium]|nr:T9SS type A sorting domain-containing protein [Ignavibacteriaceae bacterium]